MVDGNTVSFDHSYSNDYDGKDASKMTNSSESFGILSQGKTLSVEARSPVARFDTIHYQLTNMHIQPYQLRFVPEQMADERLTAFLEDRFLNTRTSISLSDSSFVDFSVTADPASAATDRFILIFRKWRLIQDPSGIMHEGKPPVAVSGTQTPGKISVYPNPVVNKTIEVIFSNIAPGNFALQLQNSNGQIIREENLAVDGNNFRRSIKVPLIPAGYYNLLIISEDGSKTTLPLLIR